MNEVLNVELTKCYDTCCQNIQILHVNEVHEDLRQEFVNNPNLKAATVLYSNLIIYGDKTHNTTIQHELTHAMSENVMKDSMIEFLNELKDNIKYSKVYNSINTIENFIRKLENDEYPYLLEKGSLLQCIRTFCNNEGSYDLLHQFLSLADKGLDALYKHDQDLFAKYYKQDQQSENIDIKFADFIDMLRDGESYKGLLAIQEIAPRLVEDVITDGKRYNFIDKINARYCSQQNNEQVSFEKDDLETLQMILKIIESYKDILPENFFDKHIEALQSNIAVIENVMKEREEKMKKIHDFKIPTGGKIQP